MPCDNGCVEYIPVYMPFRRFANFNSHISVVFWAAPKKTTNHHSQQQQQQRQPRQFSPTCWRETGKGDLEVLICVFPYRTDSLNKPASIHCNMFQTRFTWWLLIVSLAVVVSIAEGGRKLRGIRPGQFDDLKQKVTNTQMRDTVRGKKTNRELSHQGNTNNEEQQNDAVPVKKGTVVRKEPENNDKERSLQTTGGGRIVKFYTVRSLCACSSSL